MESPTLQVALRIRNDICYAPGKCLAHSRCPIIGEESMGGRGTIGVGRINLQRCFRGEGPGLES